MNSIRRLHDPKLKTLDCTVRDGGLINNHKFSDEFVRALYLANVAAGVDCMELGYKNSREIFSVDENGPWKFCQEDDLRRIVGDNPTQMKLSCMIDATKSDWKKDVLPKSQSPLDVIRVAFYQYQTDEAIAMIEDAWEKGYEVSANLMAVTTVEEKVLDAVLERLVKTPAAVIVVVDSFGFVTLSQMEYLTKKYCDVAIPAGKEVGVHMHTNLQLAFANTLVAARCGATRLDATLNGLGRGAGNCPMELLLGVFDDDRYDLRPLYECLERQILPLRQQIEWGPYPEFVMTGQNNVHPRSAIAARKSEETRDKYVAFYDQNKRKKAEAEK